MHKMLAILGSVTLCGAAFAADLPDRSALSYEENATINAACAGAIAQGPGAFQACVAKQIAQLREHPTPDRSTLSPSRDHAILSDCNYLRRTGIGLYNDCIRAAMAAPEPKPTLVQNANDEPAPNYAPYFTEDVIEVLPVDLDRRAHQEDRAHRHRRARESVASRDADAQHHARHRGHDLREVAAHRLPRPKQSPAHQDQARSEGGQSRGDAHHH